jgi:hypothetical protein
VSITSSVLYDYIQMRVANASDEIVLTEVRHLAEVVEQQNKKLIAARSWRSKVPDMILGGVIGALISAVFAALLGWG